MTKRDYDPKENIERGRHESDEPDIPESKKKYADEAKGIAEVNVKNAHASGDGSIERNDKRLDEKDTGDPQID